MGKLQGTTSYEHIKPQNKANHQQAKKCNVLRAKVSTYAGAKVAQ
jgi:hypothetical protein